MLKTLTLAIALLTSLVSICQTVKTEQLKLADLEFDSIFGHPKNDSLNIFCILGRGYFRTPSSENSDSLTSNWLAAHPKSFVVIVSSFGPMMNDKMKTKMTFCWIIDKKDTLNNYLIRNGCFPGGTMQRPQTWGEMNGKQRKLYKGMSKPNVKVLIDKKSYNNFIEQIKSCEIFASKNKLGVWSERKEK